MTSHGCAGRDWALYTHEADIGVHVAAVRAATSGRVAVSRGERPDTAAAWFLRILGCKAATP